MTLFFLSRLFRCFAPFFLLPATVLAQHPEGFRELKIGDAAPDFKLPGIDHRTMSLGDFKNASILAVLFTSNHCPVSHAAVPRLIRTYQEFKSKGLEIVAINPNHPEGVRLDELGYSKFGDSFEEMAPYAKEVGMPFPYLYDGGTQSTAMAYGCLATPHVFVFDRDRKLRYKGRIDDSHFPGDEHVKKAEFRDAVAALAAGEPVRVEVTNPIGCSTKWRTKQPEVRVAQEQWEGRPVKLEKVDAAAVARLRANATKNYRLINVWATTCAPCAEEFPSLVRIARRMGMRALEVVTISTDLPADEPKVEAFLRKHRSGALKNHLFTGGNMDSLVEALDPEWAGPQPHTILVAPGGDIVFRHNGKFEEEQLLEKLINELTPYYQP